MLVRGTQEQKPLALEFGKDTVYVRNNIRRIEKTAEDDFEGWEYEETTYTYSEYVKKQQEDGDNVKLALAELAEIVGG